MSAPIRITDAEREWLRFAADILAGRNEQISLAQRRKAASFVRLIADRDQEARDRMCSTSNDPLDTQPTV